MAGSEENTGRKNAGDENDLVMATDIKMVFITLANRYTSLEWEVEVAWQELKKNYSHKKRYYHTLAHLENIYNELDSVKEQIEDWPTVMFSMFYHDVVYEVHRKDNEERSAELAVKRLRDIYADDGLVEKCRLQILATKTHELSSDNDTNLFTDADLSILGKEWEQYKTYTEQIRKEYGIYPDLIYKPGRKKVLQHFLEMERIYKTEVFYNKYEAQARGNMRKEMEGL